MYVQNSNSFLYSAPQQNTQDYAIKEIKAQLPNEVSLENFSEKASISFNALTLGLETQEKNRLASKLNSISKAAAFSSLNGFDSQQERNVVNQYFGNFEGVLSDEAIINMINSKLNNPAYKDREFLQSFVQSLESPLQSIDITI